MDLTQTSRDIVAHSHSPHAERKFDGVLSQKMWKRVKNLKSALPDSFNWEVYDELHAKYSEGTPVRGGVIFKKTFRLQNFHSSCSMCHYSLEIDTYGRGCVHDCAFCYAKDMLVTHGYWNRPRPFPIDLSEVRKIMYTVFETDRPSKWRSILARRIPLRIGSMSDSFMWMDLKYKITHELLSILKYYRYPYVVFTRSDLVAHDEYLKVMDPKIAAIQFSISGNNESLTKQIEPGAPSVKRRMNALKKLCDSGYWATVRINPLFPEFPDGYYTRPEQVAKRFAGNPIPRLELLSSSFMQEIADVGVKSVLTGFVRLSTWSVNRMAEALDVDFQSFFERVPGERFGDWIYSDKEIAFYYAKLREQARSAGLRFSTCYIGNGEKDYYNYQNMWSNKRDCCDIVGNVPAFKTSCQEIPFEVRRFHAAPEWQKKSETPTQPSVRPNIQQVEASI